MGGAVKKVGGLLSGGAKALGGAAGMGKVDPGKMYKPNEGAFKDTKAQAAYAAMLKKQMAAKPVDNTLAQKQLAQATNRNIAQQAAQAAAQRGNAALAGREAMRNSASMGQQAAADSSILRAQESQAMMQQQRQDQAAYGAELARKQQQLQALEAMKSGQTQAFEDRKYGAAASRNAQKAAVTGSVIGAVVKSDENDKKDITPKSLEDFASKLKAYDFKYKKPNGESYQEGNVSGVMAQDLEKSSLGKNVVMDTDDGKMVDLQKALPLALGSIGEMAKRIKELEKSKKS